MRHDHVRKLGSADFIIRTPESYSGIQVASIKTPEQAEAAIAELLGPVYEERTDLPKRNTCTTR